MKPTLSRVFDTNKIIDAFAKIGIGQAGSDFVEYISGFVEQTLRGLVNGLNFQDNIDCKISTVTLMDNVAQIVNLDSVRQPIGCFPTRVVTSLYDLDSFNWWMSSTGEFTVRATFKNSPPVGTKLDVQLFILF